MNEDSLDSLVGKPEREAIEALKSSGWTVRIRSRDGEFFMGTEDMRTDRANIHIVDGQITKITIG